MKVLGLLFSFLICNFTFSQNAFVQLKGGDTNIYKSIELIQEKYEKPYIETNDGTIYRMEQIKSFQNNDGFFINNYLTKNKNDFAQRVINGKINVYQYDLSGNFIQNGQSSDRQYFGYQKQEEPLKQMIYSNLIKDLIDNTEALKKLNKIQKTKQIAPLYYVLGGASILTAGILFNTDQSDLSTPIFIGGIGFFSIPFILNSQRQKRMDNAVKIYNAG